MAGSFCSSLLTIAFALIGNNVDIASAVALRNLEIPLVLRLVCILASTL